VGREGISLRIKKSRISRIWIGATDKLDLHDIMRRNHAGIAGMKLLGQPFPSQPIRNGVDPFRNNQRRAFLPFAKEIAHWPIEGTAHFDGLASPRDECKRSIDLADG